jgi:hypothetical protein
MLIIIERNAGKRTVFRLLVAGVEVFRSYKRADVFAKQKELLLAKAAA